MRFLSSRRTTKSCRKLAAESLESRVLLAADIVTGLTHHWTFDETSGDVAFDSAGSDNATLYNWGATEQKWVQGRVGGALDFGANNNYVITDTGIPQAQTTYAFWLNVTARTGVNPRLIAPTDGKDGWIVVNNETNRGVGFYYNHGATLAQDPNPTGLGVWEHYAVLYDQPNSQVTIYRNGVEVRSATFTANVPIGQWILGHNTDTSNGNDSYNGLMDDLRVYDRLLSQEDIAELASMGSEPPPPVGLIHHWTFDETSGNVAADSVGDNDILLNGWSAGEQQWVQGRVGGALDFSDANDYGITEMGIPQDQYTIAFWLNVTDRSGINPRLVAPTDGKDGWIVLNNETNRGVGFYYNHGATLAQDPTPTGIGVWEHYAIVFDRPNSLVTIYRDGQEVRTATFSDDVPFGQWFVGHSADPSNTSDSFKGLMDDLRVYNTLLTQTEVQELADMGSNPPEPMGLVAHWTFDETSGTVAADSVGDNDILLHNWGPGEQPWVAGRIGGALDFGDNNNYGLTTDPIPYNQYSIAFWLNVTARTGVNPRLVSPADGYEGWVVLNQESHRGVGFYYNHGATNAQDPNPPALGVWEHYAVVFDRPHSLVTIYRDGQEVRTAAFSDDVPFGQWFLGHNTDPGNGNDSFNGLMDDLRIYNTLLTAEEVQQLAGAVTIENVQLDHDTIDEGGQVSLSGSFTAGIPSDEHTVTVDWGDGSEPSVLTLAPEDEDFELNHTYLDDPVGTDDTYPIVVRVSEPSGTFFDETTVDIAVHNVAPVADAGADRTVDEGDAVHLSGMFTDPGVQDVHTFLWQVSADNGQIIADGDQQDFDFVPDDNGVYTLSFTVFDDDGGSDTDTVVVTVENVAPTATIDGPTSAVPFQSRSFTLSASDPSSVDSAAPFGFDIDYGDGSVGESLVANSGVVVEHTYTTPGVYTIKVSATDKDHATGPLAEHVVVVSSAALDDGVLAIGGTGGDDSLSIFPSFGGVGVVLNGQQLGTFQDVDRVIAYGGPGADTMVATLTVPVWMFGGAGNDVLIGGSGPNALFGGDGDDTLTGGDGRDLLVGGIGSDILLGTQADDILIAGTTAFDSNLSAIDAILAEWNSAASYAVRVQNLTDGSGSADRQNGDYFLVAGETVFEDSDADQLVGGGGQDWFFFDTDQDSAVLAVDEVFANEF